MFAFSAAGFIATRTSGRSPAVRMSWSAIWIWNDDTPGRVPWGARISAGKLGCVARSLPNAAASEVKRSPVSCMPSPESPAKRMTTRSSLVVFASVVMGSCLWSAFCPYGASFTSCLASESKITSVEPS